MTVLKTPLRVHVVAGGFPRGTSAGHDIDFARLRILEELGRHERVVASVSADFAELEAWLAPCGLLVTYVAGPYPDAAQVEALSAWLAGGGRWLALHGTSGGRAVPLPDGAAGRTMARAAHHGLLGAFFLNHPPIRRFTVDVARADHPVTRDLPASFEVADELYLLELTAPADTDVLLTTSDLSAHDPAPRNFGFSYEADTSIQPDGRTRVLGFERKHGAGAVVYVALGHCHTPSTNIQPFVDASVDAGGVTPLHFRGPWETDAFRTLLRNGVEWGLGAFPTR